MRTFIRKKHLHTISRVFWGVVFSAIITLAILIQLARQAFPLLNDYRDLISQKLGDTLGVVISIDEIDAKWSGTKPQLTLRGVIVRTPEQLPIFKFNEASAELSLIPSLRHFSLAWERLTFDDFDARLVQKEDGLWEIPGYEMSTADEDRSFRIDDPFDIFLFGRRVDINNIKLDLSFRDGRRSLVSLPKLTLENDDFFHRLEANIALDDNKEAFQLTVEGYGDPRNEDEFSSKGYLSFNQFPLERLAAALAIDITGVQTPKNVEVKQRIDLSLWFSGNPKNGIDLLGRFSGGSEFDTQYADIPLPNRLSGDFTGRWQRDIGGQINLQNVGIDWLEKIFSIDRASLFGTIKDDQTQYGLRLDELNLESLSKQLRSVLKKSQPAVFEVLDALDLTGTISPFDVVLKPKEEGYFLAKGFMSNGSTKSFRASPVINGVNGYFEASLNHGAINLLSENGFSLHLPQIYEAPMVFDQAKGIVDWQIDLEHKKAHINSSRIFVKSIDEEASGLLSLSLPFKREVGEAWMTLAIGAGHIPASSHKKYVPEKAPKALRSWLNKAIQGGDLKNGGFLYNGPIVKNPSITPNIQVKGSFVDTVLKFQDQWPEVRKLNGYFHFDNRRFDGRVDAGNMLGAEITRGNVVLSKSSKKEPFVLSISTSGYGQAESAKAIVEQSNLPQGLKNTFKNWDINGKLGFNSEFSLPIQKKIELDYTLNFALNNVDLTLQDLNLPFKGLNGNVKISSDDLISSSPISGKLFDKAIEAEMFSELDTKSLGIDFKANVDVANLRAWLKRPELAFAEGETIANGRLRIPLSGEAAAGQSETTGGEIITLPNKLRGINLSLLSDLKGVSIKLPKPFDKTPDQVLAFSSDITMEKDVKSYHFVLGSQASVLVNTNDTGTSVGIVLNDNPKSSILDYSALFSREQRRRQNIFVSGHLNRLTLFDWLGVKDEYITHLSKVSAQVGRGDENIKETGKVPFTTHLNLNATDLALGSITFEEARVLGKGDEQQWYFEVTSDDAKGEVYLYSDERPMKLAIEKLNIPGNTDDRKIKQIKEELGISAESFPSSGSRVSAQSGHNETVRVKSSGTEKSSDVDLSVESDINLISNTSENNDLSSTELNSEETKNTSNEKQSFLTNIDLSKLPPMTVSIGKLSFDNKDFGSWSFEFKPSATSVIFEKLFANVRGLKIVGAQRSKEHKLGFSEDSTGANFIWTREGNDYHHSRFDGQLKGQNLDRILSAWGQEKLVDAKSFSLEANIDWLGAPDQVTLERLHGDIGFQLNEGNFIRGAEVGENPLLRLFALLNFDTLARRLRLDFSDLAARGFAYDRVVGNIAFDDGVMYLAPPLKVESSSSSMQLAGTVDLMKEEVDAELVATLPVGSNAAFATAFIAGLPAALGVYAVSKILRKQVDKASSINYGITGSWTDPKMRVKSIFNNTAATKKGEQTREKLDAGVEAEGNSDFEEVKQNTLKDEIPQAPHTIDEPFVNDIIETPAANIN